MLEVGTDGIIISANNKAARLLSGFCKNISVPRLEGLDIFMLGGDNDKACRDSAKAPEIVSSLTGITLLDSFSYPDAEIIRFTGYSGSFPFVNITRHSSSLLFELDRGLNFIFASESFLRLSGMNRADLYGLNISCLISDRDFIRFRTSVEELSENRMDYAEIGDFIFSFDEVAPGYKIEVYVPLQDGDWTGGYICIIPDASLHRKCGELDLLSNRINEVLNFAGAVSHDCNNALTAVLGNISLAKMECRGDGDVEELLADAENAALKIKNLTEKLGVFIRNMKPQNR